MTNAVPPFDLVLFGATGFTGRLVATRLAQRLGTNSGLRWALAGRDGRRLIEVRDAIDPGGGLQVLEVDAHDPGALAALARRTRTVITTVGPYQLHGSDLVAACAEAGTDYLDLCGEPEWMRRMIDAHDETAKRTGARILFSCGFDSLPFELGVLRLQNEAIRRFGAPFPRVKGRVMQLQGGLSGGTLASLNATMARAADNPEALAHLRDPFALVPGFKGPEQPRGNRVEYDADLGAWVAPFMMAAINTRNVHRSNALLGHLYGTDFVYDEMQIGGPGGAGQARAANLAALAASPNDSVKPGEGPSAEEQEAGHFDVRFLGLGAEQQRLTVAVTGDRDPGYGATSRMIVETALCLLDSGAGPAGGCWTPGAALGATVERALSANAGMTFRTLDG